MCGVDQIFIMSKLTLVLGGIKSGKSLFAENLAYCFSKKNDINVNGIAYLATAEVRDDEMSERVLRHQQRRPEEWLTLEAPLRPEMEISNLDNGIKFLIIDCITLYLSNLLLQNESGEFEGDNCCWSGKIDTILERVEKLCHLCKEKDLDVVVVSNEVGLCIVPDNKLGRVFNDIQGQANQIIAKYADIVYLVVAGIPQRLK